MKRVEGDIPPAESRVSAPGPGSSPGTREGLGGDHGWHFLACLHLWWAALRRVWMEGAEMPPEPVGMPRDPYSRYLRLAPFLTRAERRMAMRLVELTLSWRRGNAHRVKHQLFEGRSGRWTARLSRSRQQSFLKRYSDPGSRSGRAGLAPPDGVRAPSLRTADPPSRPPHKCTRSLAPPA